ncbi:MULTISPECIES: sulfatase-like hydrolase/transferase [Haloferacaceae]|uniref:Sulfatase-like hydrolase/transferase n=1 Tax=Halorubrum glutamatedens TaxID=2707018 RepID=A0ABD5QRC3_9EURY|nr:sulfatase-like hydrolase/transferase [Halobellus captivus]
MNVLFISIDSLNRHFLRSYRPNSPIDIETPNLDEFADRAAVFDNHYAGSLPCMPARREWLTGTQEFLWRPWGPIEPFDTVLPEVVRSQNVLTQLVTDHFHYFQHGSNGYHESFNGVEFIRGQEYDRWRTSPRDPDGELLSQLRRDGSGASDDLNLDAGTASDEPDDLRFMNRAAYARNAAGFDVESDFFAPKVFSRAANWLETNEEWSDWFCYVDSFDVHEPFHVPEPYASMYTDEDPTDPELPIWPYYGRTDEGQSELSDRELAFIESQYAAELTMVDEWFGTVLRTLDDRNLWEKTAVILTSDHGFYLGENGYVGKPFEAPVRNELARTPLMIWHPGSSRMGDRIDELTAAVDLFATMADVLGLEVDGAPHSRSLLPLLTDEVDDHREWALYGYWGSSVNVTDGTYTYHRPCDESTSTHCYSTTMMDSVGWFTPTRPKHDAESGRFLPYTDCPVWKFEGPSHGRHEEPLLYDVESDPWQRRNLAGREPERSEEMRSLLVDALTELDAPANQFDRLGLERPRP